MTATKTKKGKAGRIIGRVLLIIAVIIAVLLLAALAAVLRLKANFTAPERVDGRGVLYSVEYTGELPSLTRYSAVYHNSEPAVDIWVYPDYTKSYHFE